jgi:hypothetical protein
VKSSKPANTTPEVIIYSLAALGICLAMATNHIPTLDHLGIVIGTFIFSRIILNSNSIRSNNGELSLSRMLAIIFGGGILSFTPWWVSTQQDPIRGLGWLLVACIPVVPIYFAPQLSNHLRKLLKLELQAKQ